MKSLSKVLLSLAVLLLAGCETVKVVVVEKNTWKTTSVDSVLLEDCHVEPLTTREKYLQMSLDEREDHLTRVLAQQYKNTGKCTVDKQGIRKSIEKQKSLIEKYNAEEEKRVLEKKKELEK